MTEENNLERSIGRLEGKLELMYQDLHSLRVSFEKLEIGRLSVLEKEFANLTGKLSIVAAVVSFIISFVFFLAQRFLFK